MMLLWANHVVEKGPEKCISGGKLRMSLHGRVAYAASHVAWLLFSNLWRFATIKNWFSGTRCFRPYNPRPYC
jgi:hypothetical protein